MIFEFKLKNFKILYEDNYGELIMQRYFELEDEGLPIERGVLHHCTATERLRIIEKSIATMKTGLRKASTKYVDKSLVGSYFKKLFEYFKLPSQPSINELKGLMGVQQENQF